MFIHDFNNAYLSGFMLNKLLQSAIYFSLL